MSVDDLSDFDVHTIMQGDTSPDIDATLLDGAGTAIDVSGATVTFQMFSKAGVKLAEGVCTLTDAANGRVAYAWTSGETDIAGVHRGVFVIDYSGGKQETVPNRLETKMLIEIDARPGAAP